MQVGDLVRILTNHYLPTSILAERHGQLAVIIEYADDVVNTWKVKVVDGPVLWLKPNELELV